MPPTVSHRQSPTDSLPPTITPQPPTDYATSVTHANRRCSVTHTNRSCPHSHVSSIGVLAQREDGMSTLQGMFAGAGATLGVKSFNFFNLAGWREMQHSRHTLAKLLFTTHSVLSTQN